jgi:hypothetical protein
MTDVTASGEPAQRTTVVAAASSVDAGGTTWRLRSLVAMGHGAKRIACALRTRPQVVRALLRGEAVVVTPGFRDLVCQLWEAWWDKLPAQATSGQRRAVTAARRRAERNGWCPPMGLDEELLDEPGYRPYSIYRPATGTGTAADFRPAASRAAGRST